MAFTKDHRTHRFAIAPLAQVRADIVARQLRVEELRRLVASGAYKVDPLRVAMAILFKSFGAYSPEKRT
jgi:anti-sigma28 factor (negative regulator of flagellin synthesis)